MSDPTETGFLGRWSERKRRGAASPAVDDAGRPPDIASSNVDASAPRIADGATAEVPAVDTEARADDPPPLTDADMPPVESLQGDSDVSAFFSDGVSAALRRAALRQVFRAARFNVRDGLNDYDGDYTVFEPLGDTVTADMKFHAARRERLAREAAEREEAERLARLDVSDERDDGALADETADAAPTQDADTPSERDGREPEAEPVDDRLPSEAGEPASADAPSTPSSTGRASPTDAPT